jgi:mono/diheme cytochrome c family protein
MLQTMTTLKICLVVAVAAIAFAALFVYSGAFDVAADAPHSALVYAVMETLRDRSIAVRIEGIQVPLLDEPKLVADGARHYAEMCVDCHRAPGAKESELREGLYPQPPKLTERIDASPAEMFWVIKHGIKMSALPAWGKTHDDRSIWGIVAFLQKLPEFTPEQYQALVSRNSEADHHHHDHEAGEDGSGGPQQTGHHDDAVPHNAQKR